MFPHGAKVTFDYEQHGTVRRMEGFYHDKSILTDPANPDNFIDMALRKRPDLSSVQYLADDGKPGGIIVVATSSIKLVDVLRSIDDEWV